MSDGWRAEYLIQVLSMLQELGHREAFLLVAEKEGWPREKAVEAFDGGTRDE